VHGGPQGLGLRPKTTHRQAACQNQVTAGLAVADEEERPGEWPGELGKKVLRTGKSKNEHPDALGGEKGGAETGG